MEASHKQCLLCGTENPLSLGLKFQVQASGQVTARFKGSPFLQGYNGILHGGVISALLDAAMTHCLFKLGIVAVTAELNVRYLDEIAFSSELQIIAWLDKSRRNIFFMSAEIEREGTVLAKASAKFSYRKNRD